MLDESWKLVYPKTLKKTAGELTGFLHTRLKLNLSLARDKKNSLQLKLEPTRDFGLEGYELSVNDTRIVISADTKVGIARGITSLQQLMLLNKFEDQYFIPKVTIKDWAEFEHRGLLLDCSRHYFDMSVIKEYINLLALFKMNVLHWHLTEDQGWRIPINAYPRLTSVGAFRLDANGQTYGGYYSKEEIEEVIRYASQKEITVIPEIELPGHAQAALASYPWLSCTNDSIAVANDWGVFKDIYCAGNDSVFDFLETVLTEVMVLFPSEKIHIGGDEAPKIRWENCAKCQKRMLTEGLSSEEELQSYFIQRIQNFLARNGRRIIGWDEILEGGVSKDAIVQSWRGMEGGIEAVKHGNQAIMSPTSHAYFDYGLAAIDLKKVYSFYPIPEGLTKAEASLIIGGECNMWTERVPDRATLDNRVFPRLLAMSEVLWSDSTQRNFPEFQKRVQSFYPILDALGVKYGEESVALSYTMELKSNQAQLVLTPYSDGIDMEYRYLCSDCDTSLNVYSKPISIDQSGIIQIQPKKNAKNYGPIISIPVANHMGLNAEVKYSSEYSQWYTGGGNQALVDAKLGTLNSRDGSWQGFWGEDLECTLKLVKPNTLISSVSANFFQYNNSWVFIPEEIEVEVSNDGIEWKLWGITKSDVDPKKRGTFIHLLEVKIAEPEPVSYLRVKVKNLGKVPEWHEAAGSDAWIFIDEIIVK